MSDLDKLQAELMSDPDYKEYYEQMKPAADISKAMIGARLQLGLTQEDLSKRTGIRQADISRLESCDSNPSLKTLQRIAEGLEMRLKIEFVPLNGSSAPTEDKS